MIMKKTLQITEELDSIKQVAEVLMTDWEILSEEVERLTAE